MNLTHRKRNKIFIRGNGKGRRGSGEGCEDGDMVLGEGARKGLGVSGGR